MAYQMFRPAVRPYGRACRRGGVGPRQQGVENRPAREPRARRKAAGARLAAALVFAALSPGHALAQPVGNPLAVFSGLDKITGRIISFEVAINETVQFGALQLTPRVCNTRPATEAPNTTAYVEIYEVTFRSEHKRLFEGWMFAASPGLHGVEHPVYDVWLTGCKGGVEPAPPARLEER